MRGLLTYMWPDQVWPAVTVCLGYDFVSVVGSDVVCDRCEYACTCPVAMSPLVCERHFRGQCLFLMPGSPGESCLLAHSLGNQPPPLFPPPTHSSPWPKTQCGGDREGTQG